MDQVETFELVPFRGSDLNMITSQDLDVEIPKLTLLVAAWNEGQNISTFIHSYLQLDYPCRELVLCAGGTDGTFEEASRFASDSIRVLQQLPGEGKQGALRKVFQHSKGDIIVLTDADCILDSENLRRLIQPILTGEALVTSGHSAPKQSQLTHPFVFYQYAMQQRWGAALQRKKNLKAMLGRNSAMKRSALEAVGAFDEDVAIGTDSHLAKKFIAHGIGIRFIPTSIVETDFSTNLLAYLRQRSRWRRNGIIHNLQFRHYRRLFRAVLLTLRGLAMCVLPFFGLWLSKPVFYFWLALVIYSFFIRSKQIYSLRKSRNIVSPTIYLKILPYMFSEWAAQALGLIQLVSPRARNQW